MSFLYFVITQGLKVIAWPVLNFMDIRKERSFPFRTHPTHPPLLRVVIPPYFEWLPPPLLQMATPSPTLNGTPPPLLRIAPTISTFKGKCLHIYLVCYSVCIYLVKVHSLIFMFSLVAVFYDTFFVCDFLQKSLFHPLYV